jgi:hypothetical protein
MEVVFVSSRSSGAGASAAWANPHTDWGLCKWRASNWMMFLKKGVFTFIHFCLESLLSVAEKV